MVHVLSYAVGSTATAICFRAYSTGSPGLFQKTQATGLSRSSSRIGERDQWRKAAILNGELAVTDHMGGQSLPISCNGGTYPTFAFDLLWLNGEDLTKLPLLARKEKLKWILPSRSAHVSMSTFTRQWHCALSLSLFSSAPAGALSFFMRLLFATTVLPQKLG